MVRRGRRHRRRHPRCRRRVELFVLPSLPVDPAPCLDLRRHPGVAVGAQDLCRPTTRAFTGEVSGAMLRRARLPLRRGRARRAARACSARPTSWSRAKAAAALRNGLDPGALRRRARARPPSTRPPPNVPPRNWSVVVDAAAAPGPSGAADRRLRAALGDRRARARPGRAHHRRLRGAASRARRPGRPRRQPGHLRRKRRTGLLTRLGGQRRRPVPRPVRPRPRRPRSDSRRGAPIAGGSARSDHRPQHLRLLLAVAPTASRSRSSLADMIAETTAGGVDLFQICDYPPVDDLRPRSAQPRCGRTPTTSGSARARHPRSRSRITCAATSSRPGARRHTGRSHAQHRRPPADAAEASRLLRQVVPALRGGRGHPGPGDLRAGAVDRPVDMVRASTHRPRHLPRPGQLRRRAGTARPTSSTGPRRTWRNMHVKDFAFTRQGRLGRLHPRRRTAGRGTARLRRMIDTVAPRARHQPDHRTLAALAGRQCATTCATRSTQWTATQPFTI